MFTGIIEEIGQITGVTQSDDITSFSILAPKSASKTEIGDSIAVDGICLTITSCENDTFSVDAIPETLFRTIVSTYKIGTMVNLETSLTLTKGISGHLVQGHVDTMGTVVQMTTKNELEIEFPPELARYLAFKGAITINGVSLTISDLQESTFKVALIPFTLQETNLGNVKKDDKVNLEVDMIARYLERMLHEKEGQSKYHFLKERNLI